MTIPDKYLNMFAKAVPVSDSATLCTQNGNPLTVEFPPLEESGFVRYFLAPKIDQEEDE